MLYLYGKTRQDFDWYQSSLSNYDESNWTWKLNINIYKVTFLLYQLLIFLNLFNKYLLRQRDCKKKVSNRGRLVTIFYFTWPVVRKKQLFMIGLICPIHKHGSNMKVNSCYPVSVLTMISTTKRSNFEFSGLIQLFAMLYICDVCHIKCHIKK